MKTVRTPPFSAWLTGGMNHTATWARFGCLRPSAIALRFCSRSSALTSASRSRCLSSKNCLFIECDDQCACLRPHAFEQGMPLHDVYRARDPPLGMLALELHRPLPHQPRPPFVVAVASRLAVEHEGIG